MGGTHLLTYSIGLIIGICIGALVTRHPFRKRHVDDSKKAKRCESCSSPN